MIVDESSYKTGSLTRNRFLAGAGTVLTGLAGSWFFANAADAVTPPEGCYGYNACPSCSGATCTGSSCTRLVGNCSPGQQCWTSCAYIGSVLYRFQCCDWVHNGADCICRSALRPCT
jgi:hypothetical protein